MKFASLGSGSSGNATLVSFQETTLLIDCGFTLKELEKRLARLDMSPEQINALVITHEHADHIRGVGPLARKYNLPVYLTPGTYYGGRFGELPKIEFIDTHQHFSISSIRAEPITVPHDAREPCQFIFYGGNKRLGILTDLGSITPFIRSRYRDLDALLLECNHDPRMLREGPYPPALKARVGGDYGHLSNVQAAELVDAVGITKLQYLVISHISQHNNRPDLAVGELRKVICEDESILMVADQHQGYAWKEIV